jgi:hypothetical protein
MPLTSNTTTIFLALTNGQTSSAWANYSTRQLTVVSTLNTITNTTHNLLDTFDANYLKFNGTNQYLSTSGTDFMFGDSAFTMECWIYPTTSNVIRGIACTWQSGGAWEWTIQADNTIQFMYTKISSGSASQTYKGATTILPDVWTHVTVMRIGNFLTFYINGITDAGGEYDISSASTMYWYNGSTKDLRIGVGADLSNYFKGNITNFRIIKGTSAYGDWFIPCSNILSIIDDTNTKLILNSANSAMYLKDTSQYNRTVTNNNGITFTSSGTYYAVAFDGNTYLQGAGLYIPNISVEQNLTIEAWIYPSITNTEMGIVNNWSIGGQFIFKINAFNSLEFIWTWSDAGYDWTFTSDKKIIPNTWQHVALVKDGAKKSASFYIDGIIDTTGIYDLGMLGNFYYYNNELKDLYIGVGADQSNYFVGKMSNLRINRSIPNYVYPSLVTHKNSVFKDYSSNNAVLTTSSGITISEDNPFDIITYDAYNRMYNDLAGAYTSMTPFFYSDLNYSATEHVLQFGAFFQYCGRAYHYTVAKFGYREYATGGNGPMYAPGGIYLDFAYADGRIAVKGRSYYLDNGATSTVTPTVGTNNDGYWEIPLPFNVHFGTTTQENLDQGLFGNSYNIYNKLYIGTHGYITFDAGSTTSTNFSSTNPAGQKIFINPGTHTIQRIYYLHETNQRAYLINNEDPFNMARNNYSSDDTLDLFRIRVEATANSTTGQLGKPTLEYELVFYSPSIDGDGNYKTILAIAIGRNDALRSVGQQSFGKSRNGDPFLKFQGTSMPARSEALIAELTDLIKEPGVIHTGSAGNSAWRIALPSERAWNDYILAQQIGSARLYFHRGSSPNVPDACDGSAIVVGSVDNIYQDRRAAYSNYGTGVTIYAPGTLTMSSIGPDSIAEAESMQPLDPRQKINLKPTPSTTGTLSENYYNSSIRNSNLQGSNSYYYNMQMSGTSMASPQVAGVLACALEIYPDMTQKQAKAYIQGTAKRDQLTENPEYHGQDYNTKNWASLGGGQNLYLYYKKERAVDGVAYPKLDVREKPTSGTVYPRRRKIK